MRHGHAQIQKLGTSDSTTRWGIEKNHVIAQRVITTVSDVSFIFLFPFFFKDPRNAKTQKCKIEANVSERKKIVKEVLRKRQ